MEESIEPQSSYPALLCGVCTLQAHESERSMSAVKTLIVDYNAGFRRRVREILDLEPDVEIVGEAADGREALRKARQLKPNLVLMDVRMPGMNGIDATRQLKYEMPEIRVIILTMHDLKEYWEAAMASGASGYVVKGSLIEALLPTICRVCRGQQQRYAIRA
jgi:DNA-binding NarL/FixJ family response regulator